MVKLQLIFEVICLNLFCLNLLYAKTQTYEFDLDSKYGKTHFEVHHDSKDEYLAKRVEEIAKKDLIKVVEFFEYTPNETVHFNIDKNFKTSNGNARTFPESIINLYNYPPNNKEHLVVMEDWWQGLVVHEFTHIIHLDQTRDYTEVGKSIFGTIAKIPVAIVPRWLTEGIAVFSESKFLKAGRVQNQILKQQLRNFWKKPNSCKRIDCLDDPGSFPAGQLSYWAGGEFLTYLEKNKAGTINCLIKDNAGRIPFFLDEVFVACTSENIESNFNSFINEFMSENQKDSSEKIESIYGAVDLQKGLLLEGDKFLRVERTKKIEYLVASDLDGNVALTNTFINPISDISNAITVEDDRLGVIVSFEDDPSYKTNGKVWKIIDLDTLTEEADLNFTNDPSYVFGLSRDVYATFSYANNQWSYQKIKLENKKNIVENEYKFSKEFNVNFARKIGDKIYVKVTNNLNQNSSVLVTDLDFSNVKSLFESSKYFEILGVLNKCLVIKDNGNYFCIKESNGEYLKEVLDENLFKNVSVIEENDFFQVKFADDLYLNKSAANSVAKLEKIEIKEFENLTSEESKIETRSYPRLELYKPKYWFLAFSSSENLTNLGAMTSIADPMELHSLNASFYIFPEYSKLGGNLTYTFNDDPYGVVANIANDYDLSNVSSTLTNTSSKSLMGYYKFQNKKHTFIPYVLLGEDVTNDFISDRTTMYYGFQTVYKFQASNYVDWLKYVVVSNRFTIDSPSNGNDYLHMQNNIEGNITLDEDLFLQAKFSEGKLFKSDYRRGVIYGGGSNALAKVRAFESYSIPYGNAYGNDIWSTRIKLDFNIKDFYKGYRLIPFFFEELHGVFGYENLSADTLYIDKVYYSKEMLHSAFLGAKAKMLLFYYVPTDIDLIFSKAKTKNKSDINAINLLINIGI